MHQTIGTARSDASAGRAKADAVDWSNVRDDKSGSACSKIPHLRDMIVAGGNDTLTIGTECGVVNRSVRMSKHSNQRWAFSQHRSDADAMAFLPAVAAGFKPKRLSE